MRLVFVDTAYWIAVTNPNDPWHAAAERARKDIGDARFVTTDEVLTEFLTKLSKPRPRIRSKIAEAVREIMQDPNVEVIPQSRDSFIKGLELYEQRKDKGYSLQDCVSINVMRSKSIQEILTADHHFEQERFIILMRK